MTKGANGRLVSCGNTTKLDVIKASNDIKFKCIDTNVFDSLRHHIQSQGFESNHMTDLMKSIIVKYFDIRLRYSAKRTSDMLHHKKKRQTLTHSILFQGL